MKTTVIIFILTTSLICSALLVLAQAPPPSSNPPMAPLDAISALLLAGGATYGYFKLKNGRSR
jgi:hypothetical protein